MKGKSKFKKIALLAISGLMTLSLFNGCKAPGAGGEKKIGLIISTLNNPFFVSLKNGAEKKATELGYKLIVLDSQNDSSKESSNMEDLVSQKVDLILINPTDSDAVVNAVKAANDKNIPVITLDRASNGGTVVSHIASDNVAGGKMAAEYMIKQLNGKGKVVELQGISGASATRDRGKGFNDGIATSKDIKIVAQQSADFDRAKGLTVMENILQAQSEINAVFAHNDEMALGAIKAIEAAGRNNIIVIGFDAIDDAVKAVKDGKMLATVAQQPELIGSMGVDNAVKHLKGEKINNFIPIELKLITK